VLVKLWVITHLPPDTLWEEGEGPGIEKITESRAARGRDQEKGKFVVETWVEPRKMGRKEGEGGTCSVGGGGTV